MVELSGICRRPLIGTQSRPDFLERRREFCLLGTCVISSGRAALAYAESVPDGRLALRPDNYSGCRSSLLVVHHAADRRAARLAERSSRPESQRFTPAAACSERSELARACHARHARQRRALPAHGLVGSIPAYPGGLGRCAPAGRASRRGPPHARAETISRQLTSAVLGCS